MKQVAGLLKTKPPASVDVDRRAEAAIFVKQSSQWLAWEDKERAIRAAETAFALDPSQTNRLWLAQTLTDELVPRSSWFQLNTSLHTTLEQAIRSRSLLLDYYLLQSDAFRAGTTTNVSLPHLGYIAGTKLTDDGPGKAGLKKELENLEDQLFRAQLQFYKENYEATTNQYWRAWAGRLQTLPLYYEGDSRRQLALVQEAVETFLAMPDLPGPFPGDRLGMLLSVINALGEVTHYYQFQGDPWITGDIRTLDLQLPPLCSGARSRELWQRFCRELTTRPDPFLRFVGYAGLSRIFRDEKLGAASVPQYIQCERALRRILLDEIPGDHRYRGPKPGEVVPHNFEYYHDNLFLGTLDCFGSPLNGRQGSERETWPKEVVIEEREDVAALLRGLVAAGHADRLYPMDGHSEDATIFLVWIDYLAAHGKSAEAAEITDGLIAMGEKGPDRNKEIYQLSKLLKRRERFKNPIPAKIPGAESVAANGPDWDAYDIQRIDYSWDAGDPLWEDHGDPYQRGNLYSAADGNRLYCIQPIPGNRGIDLDVTVSWLPAGSLIYRFHVPCALTSFDDNVQGHWLKSVCSIAVAPDTLYVGTHDGLLSISLPTGRWKLIAREQGLPGGIVRALGWYRERLYLACGFDPRDGTGQGEAVFAAYDPAHTSFDILAAEKGVDGQNPWKGVRFELDDVVPDEAHDCLWLRDRERGLWKFTPSTRSFEQAVSTGTSSNRVSNVMTTRTRHVHNVNTSGSPYIRLIRIPDLSSIELPRSIGSTMLNTCTYLAAFDEDVVFAGARVSGWAPKGLLFLLKPGKPPAQLFRTSDGKPFPGILLLQETGAGVVVFAINGEAYLIQRKSKLGEYRRAELESANGNARETQLLDAAESGQSKAVEELLSAGVNINALDHRGWRPLHYAIDRKRTETALLLIHKGADINLATAAGYTPLAFAAKRNEVVIVKELLARHVSVDTVAMEDGATPLTCAARTGATEAAALLIAAGADVNHRGTRRRYSPIIADAAERGEMGMVHLLVKHGAKLEQPDLRGDTALAYAARVGQTNVVAGLIQLGANLNAINHGDWTPLVQAVKANQLESVKLLAEAGADLNRLGHGRTALMVAARDATFEMVQCLVDHGAKASIANGEWTALRYAELEKHHEIVAILRKALEAEKQKGKP